MFTAIPHKIDALSERIGRAAAGFLETRLGKIFLSLSLIGPLTFLPTVWNAWTDPNIDSLRTLTWPLMVIINASVYLDLCRKGSWQLRLVMIFWMLMMAAVWLATLVR